MDKFYITISRQFGSMGRSIAQALSDELKINFIDRDIVEETAKRMNLPVSQISAEEEDVSSAFSYRAFPLGIGVPSIKDEIFQVQKNIIQDYVKKESCIIVGRCASHLLKEEKNVLNVYIYAPYETRLNNCLTKLGMSEKVAKKTIQAVDTARENYQKYYIPGYKTPFSTADICINSGMFEIEEAAKLIANIAREKFIHE